MNQTFSNSGQVNETIHPGDKMYNHMKKKGKERGYILSGYNNTKVFWNLVNQQNPSLVKDKRVMDYGCGHGRMTRHMQNFFKPSILVGADVLEDGVAFCAKEFGTVPFVISKDTPISRLNETIDVIIAVSVFSHLPLKAFEDNLSSLDKVLSQDGVLMFTANGQHWKQKHGIELDNGFYFGNLSQRSSDSKFNTSNLPLQEYGQTCVSVGFVEETLKRANMRLVEHIPEGHAKSQDIYIARH